MSVLDALAAGHDLHSSAFNTGFCGQERRILTASTKETREHVKWIGVMLTSFVGFQTFLRINA
jgi:hypothetical protein